MSTISRTQRKALEFASDGRDGRLHRWPGGYWSDDAYLGQTHQPHRWVGTHTIEALRKRGFVSPVEGARLTRGDYTIVEMTPAGREAFTTRTPNTSRLGTGEPPTL